MNIKTTYKLNINFITSQQNKKFVEILFPWRFITIFKSNRVSFRFWRYALPHNLQETYCDFATNTKLQILFDKLAVENFWISTANLYPEFGKYILRLLIPVPSTYLAEISFSSLLAIKDKKETRSIRDYNWFAKFAN